MVCKKNTHFCSIICANFWVKNIWANFCEIVCKKFWVWKFFCKFLRNYLPKILDLKIFAQIFLQIFVQIFGKKIFAQIFAEKFAKKLAQIFYGSYLGSKPHDSLLFFWYGRMQFEIKVTFSATITNVLMSKARSAFLIFCCAELILEKVMFHQILNM